MSLKIKLRLKRRKQLSQELFSADGTVYNQTLILNDKFEVDPQLLAQQGLVRQFEKKKADQVSFYSPDMQPYYAGSWVVTLLVANLGLGATFTHLLIWNYSDIKGAWSWMSFSNLKLMYQNFNWRFWMDDGMRKQQTDDDDGELEYDPHYREMLKVKIIRLYF